MSFLAEGTLPGTGISNRNNNLYIRKTSIGLDGVFSLLELKKGDTIEFCPLILFTEKDSEFLKFTNLYNYYSFKSGKTSPGFLALGFGAIYNHSSPANAEYKLDIQQRTLTITAVSAIDANAEITINYNGKFDDNTPVVFTSPNEIYEFSITLF